MRAPTIAAIDAAEPLVLAIDIGTSSARVVLYDGRGRAIDGVVAQERYAIGARADGAAEDDPDAAIARVALRRRGTGPGRAAGQPDQRGRGRYAGYHYHGDRRGGPAADAADHLCRYA
ncbi:MAG: hypothetical protein U0Z44_15360 [Kouleothrix sp.]